MYSTTMTRATTLLLAVLAVLAMLAAFVASSSVAHASPVPDGHDIARARDNTDANGKDIARMLDTDADGDGSLRKIAGKDTVGIEKGTGKGPGKGGSKGGGCWYSPDKQKHCMNCYKKSGSGGMWCKKSQGCYYIGKDYYCPECPQNDPDPKKCKYPMSKPPSKSS
ncbi:hypothetical protein AMAG_17638 [Allomyces macrogynus ATCC 38327]|uniref:Uncharacterized protein n=1 Tax=Allomyces macrogynus (strain ATCC 38327) TaxID=578462 RepID=A0A0L0RUY3_ALLM3|nr:hypothetical protein AMAG_17638 [Allomyces macrogynus ATCC 38327]|eukprot:KNE54232.1 hypothetical protein AMAG_17638 [Allomyces macrogynus ATCC 38327]